MPYKIYFIFFVTGINKNRCIIVICRADCRFAPSQWETALLCNDVSYWLGASLDSALICIQPKDDDLLLATNVPRRNTRIHSLWIACNCHTEKAKLVYSATHKGKSRCVYNRNSIDTHYNTETQAFTNRFTSLFAVITYLILQQVDNCCNTRFSLAKSCQKHSLHYWRLCGESFAAQRIPSQRTNTAEIGNVLFS